MKEKLLREAQQYLQKGKSLAERNDHRGARQAYQQALNTLHALAPNKARDQLLAHVYLSRFQVPDKKQGQTLHDLRLGYSYAKTSKEPTIRAIAEDLWQGYIAT